MKILPIISTLTAKINFDIALVLGLCVRHGTFSPTHFHPHGKTISFMYFALLFFSFPADFLSNGQLFSADFFFYGKLYCLDLSPPASFKAGREEKS